MALLKCKMCGGNLEVEGGNTLATCDSCGSTMTVPKDSDERKANLFNRANHYRRNNEFDKALQAYENILNEDNTEAEAHWGVVLCKYGIEYVEDPQNGKRVPTCHRAQYDSVLLDTDFKQTLEYADGYSKSVYEDEAKQIDQIQKDILAISSKEEPFDVFICYKETSESGQRTKDSVLAQDIYFHLQDAGLKVFFARVTLEDKLGSAYEPYIFAALNSAKVMVVVGTKAEYLNAVWTRNEWSRFLAFAKKDKKKVLIPAYRDMDPYDLPEEFAHLQALDMSKIGFAQDLTRGILKVTRETVKPEKAFTATPTNVNGGGSPTVTSLLDRAFFCLEDDDLNKADDLLEQALNLDPRSARAYMGKLMLEYHCKRVEGLRELPETFDGSKNYQRAISFGDKEVESILIGANQAIKERNEIARKDKILAESERALVNSNVRSDLESAFRALNSIRGYKNADLLTAEYGHKVDELEYQQYKQVLDDGKRDLQTLQISYKGFKSLGSYRDSEALAHQCELLIAEIKEGLEAEALKRAKAIRNAKKKMIIVASIIVIGVGLYFLAVLLIFPSIDYAKAEELLSQGEYIQASEVFAGLGEFKDSNNRSLEAKYTFADILVEQGEYVQASEVFAGLGEFKDSNYRSLEAKYTYAERLTEEGEYIQASEVFAGLGDFKDSNNRSVALMIQAGKFPSMKQLRMCDLLACSYLLQPSIAAGYNHTVGLRADGSVVAVGLIGNSQTNVSDWTNVVAVAAGYKHTVGLRADGSVVAVGRNDYGQTDVSGWTDIVSIAAGTFHTVGLRADGSVVAVGLNSSGQTNVSHWTDIVAVAAGSFHTVGLRADGSVVAVGMNKHGQTNVSGWSDIVAIAAGDDHTVRVRADGSVVAVGRNDDGQTDVSGWTDIVAIAAGGGHTVGLRADGSVVAVGLNDDGQTDVSGWSDIVAVAAGYEHTLGLRADGSVVAVGRNDLGQANVSSWTDIMTPADRLAIAKTMLP